VRLQSAQFGAAEFQRSPAHMIDHQIIAFWKSKGVKPRMPVSSLQVEEFQRLYRVELPTSISDFYLASNGTEYDHDLISFWPLEELGTVTEKLSNSGGSPDYRNIVNVLPTPDKFFVFADYLIWSHVYAFKLSEDRYQPAPVLWIYADQWYEIAASFENFIVSYLRDYDSILFPKQLKAK
jgi:hypothetical protein